MYASNRYDREMMRVPKNYAGNAFARSGVREESAVADTPAEPMMQATAAEREELPQTVYEETPMQQQDHLPQQDEMTPSAKEDASSVQAMTTTLPTEAEKPRSHESLLRLGLGQEEMLLLGLMLLLHGDNGKGGAAGQMDELWWLLLLLLALG
ncbi:MAG: hypothetical protein IJW40_00940 [Clostridia bacterium]|nr:hypothetical protein [Clostridia bacterium]